MNIEQEEQEEFINHAKNQLLEDTLNEYQGAREIRRIMENKSLIFYSQALTAIALQSQIKSAEEKNQKAVLESKA
jgi:hypothetical protein